MTNELDSRVDGLEMLEAAFLNFPQVPCPVIHRFGPGIYIREVNIPAGTIAIGHYQKKEHVNIFLKGKLKILDDDGSVIELAAPMIFVGKPGRKFGYITEDVVWLNVYPTEETDVEKLEETYLDKSPTWKNMAAIQGFEALKRLPDVDDYRLLLSEIGLSHETVQTQTMNEEDQIPMPMGSYKFSISNSLIHGKGVFATAEIEEGEIIGPARLAGMRTPIGRYVNHSLQANARMGDHGGDIFLHAARTIEGSRGGFLGEEITTNYRETLKLMGVIKCLE